MYEYELRTNGSISYPESVLPNNIWENFINYVIQSADNEVTVKLVQDKLAKFNAVSVPGKFIYFLTAEDRMMFVLKFS